MHINVNTSLLPRDAATAKPSGFTALGSTTSHPTSAEELGSAPKLLLTPQEAATALHMSRSSLYKFLLSGEIPSIKVGRMRRIPLAALREWVLKQTAA